MESILLEQLSTLSHPQRMAIFRLLIRRYPDALPVSEILHSLTIKPSTASVYLAALKSADLVHQKRSGTHLYYSANIQASQDIVSGLFKDCCGNRADLCLPAREDQAREPRVLFLCTGNSARSIMAEAILRDWPNTSFKVASAGTDPRSKPNSIALDILETNGHNISDLNSKHLSEFRDSAFDFIFTVCDSAANEDTHAFAGAPILSHWSTLDPVPNEVPSKHVDNLRVDFQTAYDTLHKRISKFVTLSFETDNRLDLQSMVDDIASPSPESPPK